MSVSALVEYNQEFIPVTSVQHKLSLAASSFSCSSYQTILEGYGGYGSLCFKQYDLDVYKGWFLGKEQEQS